MTTSATNKPLCDFELEGYECISCTKKEKKYIIVKDYKEHLRSKHKIKEDCIPSELIGSMWDEDFIMVFKCDNKCEVCGKQLSLLRFEGHDQFLEFRCWERDNRGHFHHQFKDRVFIGKRAKNYCARHGHNSDSQNCMFCEVEGSFSRVLA